MEANRYEIEAENVRTRINSALKAKGLTENAVAAGDSSTQSRLNSQLSHGKRITLDTVLRILAACPDVSADWLLRGKGEMLDSPESSTTITNNSHNIGSPINDSVVINKLLAQLEEKDKQIQILLALLGK